MKREWEQAEGREESGESTQMRPDQRPTLDLTSIVDCIAKEMTGGGVGVTEAEHAHKTACWHRQRLLAFGARL